MHVTFTVRQLSSSFAYWPNRLTYRCTTEIDSKDPVSIAQNAIKEARAKGYDLVIVDTAGRLAVDEQMMNEIAAIKEAIQPNENSVPW